MTTGTGLQSLQAVVVCHECDLVHRRIPVIRGHKAGCRRCGATLYSTASRSFDRPLALALSGLILFAVANLCPFLTFEMQGRAQTNNLISGAIEFWQAGFGELALLVFLASIGLPLISLILIVYVLIPSSFRTVPWKAALATRLFVLLRPWAMMEVYLLGVLVAIVKLMDFAEITLEPGFYAFVVLIVTVTAANATLHPETLWQLIGSGTDDPASASSPDALIGCHECSHVSNVHHVQHGERCSRCEARLHHRKPNSIARSWALLVAAIILYIPANLYPIMTVISFGKGAPDTILSGVIHLMEADQWPIALLVFFASIFVPMLKIAMIAFLLISVQIGSTWRPKERTIAYRLTEIFGRWSMIDIFMISILVALVKLGSIATIEAGPGAVAFAAVVILTMVSAMSFDPRLIWDKVERKND